MKKLFFTSLALVLVIFSCTDLTDIESNIDDLQGRLSDLETRIEILEALDLSQAVLDIEVMQGQISSSDDIETAIDSTQAKIASIEDEIAALEEEMDNNGGTTDPGSSNIYWGDVLNDDNFAKVADGGYTIVTGRVNITKNEQLDKIQAVTFIGSDLTITDVSGDISFDALEVISGNITINSITESTSITFPNLESITGGFYSGEYADQLDSLSFPELTTVNADFSLYFGSTLGSSENTFESLNLPKLLLVGGNFELTICERLESLDLPIVYIGRDYNLHANRVLSLALSNINALETVGGSIILSDNFINYNGEPAMDQLFDVILFENLTTLGGGIRLTGSEDLYNISGFSSLERIPGTLYMSPRCIGLGNNTDVGFFNALEYVGGDLHLTHMLPVNVKGEDDGEEGFIEGFDNLLEVGRNIAIDAPEIIGFEKLEFSGDELSSGANFVVSGTILPQFSAFKGIRSGEALLNLYIENTKVDNLFPLLGTDSKSTDLSISINMSDEGGANTTLNGGFGNVTVLSSLMIDFEESDMNLTNGFLGALSQVGSSESENHSFIVKVSENTDLSVFQNYFKARTADYLFADSAFQEDWKLYELVLKEYEMGWVTEEDLLDAYPRDYNVMTDSISFLYKYSEEVTNKVLTIDYGKVKLDETNPAPAFIQAFMKYGKLTEEELGYNITNE